MSLKKFENIQLPASADFHVHLRDNEVCEAVTKTIRQGGVNTVYVMPNLVPPITTVEHALSYRSYLQKIEPNVRFLMSLYLHPSITPDTIREARKAGVTGVKSYPAGVTTNSASGVVSYETYYPIFAEMERENLILNLHGESPSGDNVTVLNAEESFLPTLLDLHARFPSLRIILEHVTTSAAISAVSSCGPTVAATITPHHLSLTIDDWVGDPINFCKPVAKLPSDRDAILRAAFSGNPKFFLGTDSAPHPVSSKFPSNGKVAAGVFTQPYATQFVLSALELACERGVLSERGVTREKLEGFLGGFGREFYGVRDERGEKIEVWKGEEVVREEVRGEDGVRIVPFWRRRRCWSLKWVE